MTSSMPARRPTRTLWIMAAGAAMMAIVLLFGLVARPAATLPTATPTAGAPSGGTAPRISLEDARAALEAGQAVFVDVRFDRDFEAGHLPGALSIPFPDLETRWTELDPTDWIILYCA
ncbi:MAG: rhodanese-like domain-containing protein [Anaerolineales bacterium]|nr:rhodanese-like domain-containing protein [Anaerolineales bacterium]